MEYMESSQISHPTLTGAAMIEQTKTLVLVVSFSISVTIYTIPLTLTMCRFLNQRLSFGTIVKMRQTLTV